MFCLDYNQTYLQQRGACLSWFGNKNIHNDVSEMLLLLVLFMFFLMSSILKPQNYWKDPKHSPLYVNMYITHLSQGWLFNIFLIIFH